MRGPLASPADSSKIVDLPTRCRIVVPAEMSQSSAAMRFAHFAFFVASALVARGADETPTPDEQKAIDAIAKAGGTAQIDPKLPAAARVAAKLESATDTVLLTLRKHRKIGAIDIQDASKCTLKGINVLPDLPNLRRLVVGKANLKLVHLNAVGRCQDLRHLALLDAGLTDGALEGLAKLTRLEHLALSDNPKISDKGMQTVKRFERLQALYLANTSLTDKGLRELKGLDGLRTLNVANSKITADAAEKFVDEMPNLRGIRR